MSTLKVDAIRHNSATSDAITTHSNGTASAKIIDIGGGQLSHRNIIINGDMRIAQRSIGPVAVSEGNNENYQTLDRFKFSFGNAATGGANVSQSSDAPTTLGFTKSHKTDVTTANTTASGGQQINIQYRIEGKDIRSSGWNHLSPSSFLTLSFYFKTTKTGNLKLPIAFRSRSGTNYYYIQNVTITDPTNWNRYTVTIPGNSNIQIDDNASAGLDIFFSYYTGSNKITSSEGTWSSTNAYRTSDSTNFFDSTSNDMFLTGVQLEVGDTATTFEHKSEQEELLRCYRYYYKMGELDYKGAHMSAGETYGIGMSDNDNTNIYCQINFPVPMREPPSTLDQAGASNYYVRRDTTQTCTGNPSLTNGSEFSFRVNFPKSNHGWGTGQMLWCQSAGSSSYLGFDAEL